MITRRIWCLCLATSISLALTDSSVAFTATAGHGGNAFASQPGDSPRADQIKTVRFRISGPRMFRPSISRPKIHGSSIMRPKFDRPSISGPRIFRASISRPLIFGPRIAGPAIATPAVGAALPCPKGHSRVGSTFYGGTICTPRAPVEQYWSGCPKGHKQVAGGIYPGARRCAPI